MSLSQADIDYQQAHINDDKQPDLYIAGIICLIAAYIFVGLRFLSRKLGGIKLELDDWCIVLALFFSSTFFASTFIYVHYGGGKHAILITKPVPFAKTLLAAEILYNPGIAFTKFSIILLYARIFPKHTNPRFRIVLWSVAGFVLAYTITSMMVNLFQCVPIRANWTPGVKSKCVSFGAELITMAVLNVMTDVVLLCLTMPILWNLRTNRVRKFQLAGMFLLGGFVCVVSIIRSTKVSMISFTDGSWVTADGAMWSLVEHGIAIVSACLPCLRPLIHFIIRGNGKVDTDVTTTDYTKQTGSKQISTLSYTSNEEWQRIHDNDDQKLFHVQQKSNIREHSLNGSERDAENGIEMITRRS